MKLIVGLGNPGPRYADTRHNVGWRVVEALAARLGAGPWKEKLGAAVTDAAWRGVKIVLARPLGFMNLSGLPVRQLMDFWKLDAEDLLVVLDDLALEVGRIRLRPDGSAGGHNGLASVIEHVGHDKIARVRIGIGPSPPAEEYSAFVLASIPKADRPAVEKSIDRAADAALAWAAEGTAAAMNRFNRGAEPRP